MSNVDPMFQTGLLHNYSVGLALAAQYEKAMNVIERELALAKELSLDFVLPHALVVKAQALLGVRRIGEAEETLKRAATSQSDYIVIVAAVFGARVPLYHGQPDKAIMLLTGVDHLRSIPSLRAEFLATKAVALAATRRFHDAISACDEALSLSTTIETSVLVAGARAITALGQGSPEAPDLARAALGQALDWGNRDSFVCVYRTCPALLGVLVADSALRPAIESVLMAANDLQLARRAGLRPSAETWHLTKRETEILVLIREGLTNKEIAGRLYVAESTVKVHVRHILRKLGVRTRTDAAVRAALSDG